MKIEISLTKQKKTNISAKYIVALIIISAVGILQSIFVERMLQMSTNPPPDWLFRVARMTAPFLPVLWQQPCIDPTFSDFVRKLEEDEKKQKTCRKKSESDAAAETSSVIKGAIMQGSSLLAAIGALHGKPQPPKPRLSKAAMLTKETKMQTDPFYRHNELMHKKKSHAHLGKRLSHGDCDFMIVKKNEENGLLGHSPSTAMSPSHNQRRNAVTNWLFRTPTTDELWAELVTRNVPTPFFSPFSYIAFFHRFRRLDPFRLLHSFLHPSMCTLCSNSFLNWTPMRQFLELTSN